jgi:hypothetical protein
MRSRHSTACSMNSLANSNEMTGTGCDNPLSTSRSYPSTSILQSRGKPCLSINASKVVTGTTMDFSQVMSLKRPSCQCEASVATVAASVASAISASPSAAPTAVRSTITPSGSRNSSARAGWGSTATTRAPILSQTLVHTP